MICILIETTRYELYVLNGRLNIVSVMNIGLSFIYGNLLYTSSDTFENYFDYMLVDTFLKK